MCIYDSLYLVEWLHVILCRYIKLLYMLLTVDMSLIYHRYYTSLNTLSVLLLIICIEKICL